MDIKDEVLNFAPRVSQFEALILNHELLKLLKDPIVNYISKYRYMFGINLSQEQELQPPPDNNINEFNQEQEDLPIYLNHRYIQFFFFKSKTIFIYF